MEKYVNYAWYTANYLLGKEPVVPETLFDYYATLASAEVNNIVSLDADLADPCDEIKAATCEIAEILCQGDGASTDEAVSIPVGISSEKVGEYSVSYSGNSATEKAVAQTRQIRGAVSKWLGKTGLLFRGV
ncbi:MAG: hypothetical protein IKE28_11900 [Solobacterium sp.]|nr:hypothetical protein [Solobacterium sp.]